MKPNFIKYLFALAGILAGIFAWASGDMETTMAITTASMSPAVIVSSDEQRAAYGRTSRWIQDHTNLDPSEYIISESTLRVEQVLAANRNNYTFDLYEGSASTDRPLETKLNRNDLFFVTHLALLIGKMDESTSPKQYANFPLFTHPDPNYFVGAPVGVPKEFQALEAVYNGVITFLTANVERFGPFLTSNLKVIPEAQFQIADGNQVNNEYPQWGPTTAARGFHRVTPNLVVDGQQTNKFVLTLGSGNIAAIEGAVNGANQAVNTRNFLALLLHGFRVVNAGQAAKASALGQPTF